MANTKNFIRKLVDKGDCGPTRDDKGLRMTIEVVLYDNGGVMVNGHYFKSKSSSAALGAGTPNSGHAVNHGAGSPSTLGQEITSQRMTQPEVLRVN